LCKKFNVSRESVETAANAVLENLIVNAQANGATSFAEKERIESYASLFEMELDLEIGQDKEVQIAPGMKVCLTGSPPAEEEFAHLTKSELRKVLASHGLEEVPSITKKCQLVVAFNKESLSGKAKRARELGIPVISSQEFLEIVDEH
jgi:NAD-dependent DNA ligase